MAKKEKIVTDPFGSYTGLVRHPEEKPVQDARPMANSMVSTGTPRISRKIR